MEQPDHDYTFEGLEPIASQISRRTDEIAYITMQDRTVTGEDEKVGRFDLTGEQLEALDLE